MQTLQNELFEELTISVQKFGGFVDKFIGDALLALFGAPTAHEDDPERALHAALDMIERTRQLGERSGLPFMLHVGINTGPVVTGGFGAGAAKAYSVTGDVVNTAQTSPVHGCSRGSVGRAAHLPSDPSRVFV